MGASERNTAARKAEKEGHKDPWFCRFCDTWYGKKRRDELTLDHVIPKSMGGPNSSWNRILACTECNWNKRSKTYEEFKGVEFLPEQCWDHFKTTDDFIAARVAAMERAAANVRVLP
jgi:5-methylcytosine-specific restriction endonuclease McrA